MRSVSVLSSKTLIDLSVETLSFGFDGEFSGIDSSRKVAIRTRSTVVAAPIKTEVAGASPAISRPLLLSPSVDFRRETLRLVARPSMRLPENSPEELFLLPPINQSAVKQQQDDLYQLVQAQRLNS